MATPRSRPPSGAWPVGGRRLGLILGIVLLALVAWWLWPSRPAPPPEAPEDSPAETLAGAEFREARIVGRYRGERQWIVDTRRLREEGEEQVRAEHLESGTLFRDGQAFLDLQAAEAIAHPSTNDLILQGDVVAVHVDGAVFRTATLQWIAAEERLVAPTPVVIERGDDRVEAERMEVFWSEDRVRLYGGVRVWEEQGRTLEAQRVDFHIDGDDMWVLGSFRAAIPPKRRAGDGGASLEPGLEPAPREADGREPAPAEGRTEPGRDQEGRDGAEPVQTES